MFPLLAKDLTERSARRRTYVLRALFGLVLIGWFWWFTPETAGFALIGIGQEMFSRLSHLLCWALLIIQPALMASALTHEKERGTLELLLLTPMRPWKLLMEKYLSGLLPMATLLLFGLPFGAIAYSYGGVSPGTLVNVGIILFTTWLLTGAAALLCSAWFRTTPSAIIGSYVFLALLFFATSPDLRRRSDDVPDLAIFDPRHKQPYESQEEPTIYFRINRDMESWLPATTNPIGLVRTISNQSFGFDAETPFTDLSAPILHPNSPLLSDYRAKFATSSSRYTILHAAWLTGITILFLAVARYFLLKRAHAKPSRGLPRLFAWMDAVLHRINLRLGGTTTSSEGAAGMENRPILWRDYHTGILGRPRYLIRIVLGIMILCTAYFAAFRTAAGFSELLRILVMVCGVVILIRAVEAIGGERHRQSLEVLVSTPIPRAEIIRQKAWPLVSLSLALLFPISFVYFARLTCFGIKRGLDAHTFGATAELTSAYFGLFGLAIAFWQLRWLGFLCGLSIRSRGKATLIALTVLGVWMFAPRIARQVLESYVSSPYIEALYLLPPDGLISFAERGSLSAVAYIMPMGTTSLGVFLACSIVLLFHCIVALTLRAQCIITADHYLTRL